MKLGGYSLNIPKLAQVPAIGRFFKPPEPLSPLGPPKQPDPPVVIHQTSNVISGGPSSYPAPAAPSQPMAAPAVPGQTQVTAPGGLYDAAQEMGNVYGIDPRNFLANSYWEHRGGQNWTQGKFASNVWWDPTKNTGEESYGPYQINMRYFGPKAVELGRITPDHPLYISPQDAMDPYASTKWQAKKWSREIKSGITDWQQLFQLHNSNEPNRGQTVQDIVNNDQFVRGQ